MVGDSRWTRYYENTTGRPPRPTLLFALDRFAEQGFAVDLGCGDGRDTVELLRRGWRVMAIDGQAEAIARLAARADLPTTGRLETLLAGFEDAEWPQADLVNASFSLFFCPPEKFPALWRKIRDSLKPGGRFAGHLIGELDSWAGGPNIVAFDRAALDQLIVGYAVEKLEIEEEDSVTPTGEAKHWHLYHLVLHKPPGKKGSRSPAGSA
jgi:tellurite methyltransferase